MKKKFPKQVFVTGIGTGVGKTIVSAILVEILKADYWKPVQCGNLDESDTYLVQSLISNKVSNFYKEAYRLKLAASPHFAAKKERVKIELNKIQSPSTKNILVMEGAGGLMVPLNEKQCVADLIRHLKTPAILIAQNYLGSINHTLLSIEVLKSRKINLLGIIFNGNGFNDNEGIIQRMSGTPVIGRISETREINKEFVAREGRKLRASLSRLFEL